MHSSEAENKPSQDQQGFTIVELMIATAIFGVMLVLIITSINSYTSDYYKANINSAAQATVQSISANVEGTIKNTSQVTSGTNAYANYYCTDNEEYLYNIGSENPTETASLSMPYALYEFPIPNGQCYPTPQSSTAGKAAYTEGSSLLGSYYRLLNFSVVQVSTTSEWLINIKLAYTSGGVNTAGDDLLCVPGDSYNGPDGCSPASNFTNFSEPGVTNAICKLNVEARQFCDVAELQSTVSNDIN
jgi:prepilin-type N-terminal cleavage/methylation domain-containing protein